MQSAAHSRKLLDRLFTFHAVIAVVIGGGCFLLPHTLASDILSGSYSHLVHEVIRLYGALTLAQGWLVWQTRKVADVFLRRTFCQAYCICFSMQFLALLKAQISSPESHIWYHWVNIIAILSLAVAYGYFLWKPIKAIGLPGYDNREM